MGKRKQETKQEVAADARADREPGRVEYWPLDEIYDNPYQPRMETDPNDPQFQELVQSIEQHGLRQIPTGRIHCNVKEMGDGHRRLSAFRYLQEKHKEGLFSRKWDLMPVYVEELADLEMADMVWEANERRKALSPIEQATLLRRYLDEFSITQTELAQRRGCSQGHIANTLRLLELPAEVRGMVSAGELTAAHGRELLVVKDDTVRKRLAAQAAENRETVNELKRQVYRAMKDQTRPLNRQRGNVRFNTRSCKECEHRVMMADFWGTDDEPYCDNPECWEAKQAEAIEKEREKATKQVEASGIVNLSKLDWNAYESMDAYRRKDIDDSQCEACEKYKLASRDGAGPGAYYCLDAACFRKKKAAKTREARKQAREDRKKLQSIIDGLDRDALAPKTPLLVSLLMFGALDFTGTKHLLEELGVEVATPEGVDKWSPQFREPHERAMMKYCLDAITVEDLARTLMLILLRKAEKYDEDGSRAKCLIAALAPERYLEVFGALPTGDKQRYWANTDLLDIVLADCRRKHEMEEPPSSAEADQTIETLMEEDMDELEDMLEAQNTVDLEAKASADPKPCDTCIGALGCDRSMLDRSEDGIWYCIVPDGTEILRVLDAGQAEKQ